jgi:hypothetical protein
MDSTHTASLDIPELNYAASIAHVFPAMENNSFLSVGQVCNEGYYVTLKIDGVTIFNYEGKAILKGHRDLGTGLWCINLRKDEPQLPIAAANNVYELRSTGALVNYLHTTMFIPTNKAFIKDVKQGHLTAYSGLTEDAINKHLKIKLATVMGNMNQKRQNIRSTSKEIQVRSDLDEATVTPAGTGEEKIRFTQWLWIKVRFTLI